MSPPPPSDTFDILAGPALPPSISNVIILRNTLQSSSPRRHQASVPRTVDSRATSYRWPGSCLVALAVQHCPLPSRASSLVLDYILENSNRLRPFEPGHRIGPAMEGSSRSRDRSPLRDATNPALSQPLNAYSQLAQNNTALHSDYSNTSFNSDPTFTSALDQTQFLSDPTFDSFSQPAQAAAIGLDDISAVNYDPNHLSPHSLSNHTSPAPETSNFSGFEFSQDSLDTTLLNANDLDLNYNMSTTMNQQHPTPPHLLQSIGRNSSSPSPRATPSNHNSPYMSRPRNASESLDPASAAFPQQEWSNMQGFRGGHRRVASDALSEISSHQLTHHHIWAQWIALMLPTRRHPC